MKRKTKRKDTVSSSSRAGSSPQGTTLSTLDGVFLFTFSIIVFIFALLNITFGTVIGLLPLLFGLFVAYPFYVGVYKGIIKDDVSERLAGWRFLLIFAGMIIIVAIFFSAPVLTSLLVDWAAIAITIVVSIVIYILMIGLVSAWNELLKTYRRILPRREKELSESALRNVWKGRRGFGTIYAATIFFVAYNLSILAAVKMYSAALIPLPPGVSTFYNPLFEIYVLVASIFVGWFLVTGYTRL